MGGPGKSTKRDPTREKLKATPNPKPKAFLRKFNRTEPSKFVQPTAPAKLPTSPDLCGGDQEQRNIAPSNTVTDKGTLGETNGSPGTGRRVGVTPSTEPTIAPIPYCTVPATGSKAARAAKAAKAADTRLVQPKARRKE